MAYFRDESEDFARAVEEGVRAGLSGDFKKSTPSLAQVHVNRPLGSGADDEDKKDDPGTQDVDPPPVVYFGDDIQNPYDHRNADDEDALKRGKKDDDPGTQDVDPPHQREAADPDYLVMGPDGGGGMGDDHDDAVATPETDKPVREDISKRISGSSNIGLNARGRMLAERLGKVIAAKGALDVLYSSPLARGRQTAQAVLDRCPHTVYAAPDPRLQPWHLGAFEGRQPARVGRQIEFFIEHPDERPLGTGNDGRRAETFNEAEQRQLGFWKDLYGDFEADPTLKIGVVAHSRGMELLKAAVDAGFPGDGDYDLRDGDLVDPDDFPHVSMLRWHGDEIKDVDLDDGGPLKPGIYPILHSLTDDDADDGNPELERAVKAFSEDEPRDDKGKWTKGGVYIDSSLDNNKAFKTALKFVARYYPKLLNDKISFRAMTQKEEKRFREAEATRHIGGASALHITDSDAPGKSDIAFREGEPTFAYVESIVHELTHARDYQAGGLKDDMQHLSQVLYQNHPDEVKASHAGFKARERYIASVSKDNGGDADNEKKADLLYLPPLEVSRAARSAWDVGASAAGITEPLAEGAGMTERQVLDVDRHHRASEAATESAVSKAAWGGVFATRWTDRVLRRIEKDKNAEWPPWTAVDLDNTLAHDVPHGDDGGSTAIGRPKAKMLARVKAAVAAGRTVKIFTARVADDPGGRQRKAIEAWCGEHVGQVLPVTCCKDPGMTDLWDDKAHAPEEIGKAFDPEQPRDETGKWTTGRPWFRRTRALRGQGLLGVRGEGGRVMGQHVYGPGIETQEEKALVNKPISSTSELKTEKEHLAEVRLVEFSDGTRGVFKPDDDPDGEQYRNEITPGMQTEREIGAWKVARLVGMQDLVGPVVRATAPASDSDGKHYSGGSGALMGWREGEVANDAARPYDGKADAQRVAVFDYVIGNADRHGGNWIVGDHDKLALIDHGLAFPESSKSFDIKNNFAAILSRPQYDQPASWAKSPTSGPGPSDFAKPYVDNREAIGESLRSLGFDASVTDGVDHRIGVLAKATSWNTMRGPRYANESEVSSSTPEDTRDRDSIHTQGGHTKDPTTYLNRQHSDTSEMRNRGMIT